MADSTTSSGPDAFEETLGRLSKKTGVKATIVVDRASGAILKKGGQISSIRTARSASVTDPAPASSVSGGGGGQQQPAGSFSGGEISSVNNGGAGESQGAEELAGLVWNFVNSAGDLVEQLDTEDELKLLRLRTKKQELVVVPNPKYLLIVVHDTPPA